MSASSYQLCYIMNVPFETYVGTYLVIESVGISVDYLSFGYTERKIDRYQSIYPQPVPSFWWRRIEAWANEEMIERNYIGLYGDIILSFMNVHLMFHLS